MNTSHITKSALALALGLCASGALANVAVTNAFENFDSYSDGDTITSLANDKGFTWSAGGDAATDTKVNASGKLVLDTGDGVVTGALSSASAFNGKIAGHNAKFSAKVAFVPATTNPIDGSDAGLKFALFAKDDGAEGTNLYVYANGGAVSTTIPIVANVETTVEVAFQSANTFDLFVGGVAATGNPYTFANDGTIAQVEFQGNGEIDDVGFTYELSTVTVSVTGDATHIESEVWTAGSRPSTLTEGDAYSVTFTTAANYTFDCGSMTTNFSGTAAQADISITIPAVVKSGYAPAEPISIKGDGDSTISHTTTTAETTYLNALVAGGKTVEQVESAVGNLTETQFEQYALLGLDATAAPTYHFDIKGIKRNSASSVTVTVELTRSAVVQNAIYGTLELYGCDTPNGTYTKIASEDINYTNAEFATADAGTGTATLTFNPSGKKFFKAKIEPVPAAAE